MDGERVARFLIRCVFTMFAEDVGLLPGKPFQSALETFEVGGGGGYTPNRLTDNALRGHAGTFDVDGFARGLTALWRAMDRGDVFGWQKLLRFNGHFFARCGSPPAQLRQTSPSLPRRRRQTGGTSSPPSSARCSRGRWTPGSATGWARSTRRANTWSAWCARRWTCPCASAGRRCRRTWRSSWPRKKTAAGKKKDRDAALGELRDFHAWLRGLRFLDPACGSGNFLYVTLHMVKRLELEVLRAIEEITGNPELGIDEVGPAQFHGIEVKPWAREIAELTLWIGYHQFWMEHHKGVNPPEPVLEDTGTLEQRDAVLAWDEIVEVPREVAP